LVSGRSIVLRRLTKDKKMTIKLNDLQRALLITASRATDQPLDATAHDGFDPAKIKTAVANLLRRQLLDKTDASGANTVPCYRITDAGLAAIGSVDEVPTAVATVACATAAPLTKTALVLSLLKRSEGATLDQMVAATGWLPHTTRAALTGLRKRGHGIARTATDKGSVYRIGVAA
jgi:Protein of unknown function (DUF3489)